LRNPLGCPAGRVFLWRFLGLTKQREHGANQSSERLAIRGFGIVSTDLLDVSEFASDDPIEVNGLYVAASRPRYALLVGCDSKKTGQGIVRQLLDGGHFSEVGGSTNA
jgi:hypothetical protein